MGTGIDQEFKLLLRGLRNQYSLDMLVADCNKDLAQAQKQYRSISRRHNTIQRYVDKIRTVLHEEKTFYGRSSPINWLARASYMHDLEKALSALHPIEAMAGRALPSPEFFERVDRRDLPAKKGSRPWDAFLLDMMVIYTRSTGVPPTSWRDPVTGEWNTTFLRGLKVLLEVLPSDVERVPMSTLGARAEAFLDEHRDGLRAFVPANVPRSLPKSRKSRKSSKERNRT